MEMVLGPGSDGGHQEHMGMQQVQVGIGDTICHTEMWWDKAGMGKTRWHNRTWWAKAGIGAHH